MRILWQSPIWEPPARFWHETGMLCARLNHDTFAICRPAGWQVTTMETWQRRYDTPIPYMVQTKPGMPVWFIIDELRTIRGGGLAEYITHTRLVHMLNLGVATLDLYIQGKKAQPQPVPVLELYTTPADTRSLAERLNYIRPTIKLRS